MHSNLKHLSGLHCPREHQGPVEKNGDNFLVVRDMPAGAHLQINTEIDLAEKTISRTFKIGAFEWHRVYSIDDFATAEIKDKSRLLEGYRLPFFSVTLTGRGGHIKVYSTDDAEDAKSVYGVIIGILGKAGKSTQQQQSG